jgi:hypothetical protein
MNELAIIKNSLGKIEGGGGGNYSHDMASQNSLVAMREQMKKLVDDKFSDLEFALNNQVITRVDSLEKQMEKHLVQAS